MHKWYIEYLYYELCRKQKLCLFSFYSKLLLSTTSSLTQSRGEAIKKLSKVFHINCASSSITSSSFETTRWLQKISPKIDSLQQKLQHQRSINKLFQRLKICIRYQNKHTYIMFSVSTCCRQQMCVTIAVERNDT